MNRIALLCSLTFLTIPLTACDHATLNINLGGPPAIAGHEEPAPDSAAAAPDQAPAAEGGAALTACWPDSTAFKAEQRAHGYSKEAWTATAAFLAGLAAVRAQHPACP